LSLQNLWNIITNPDIEAKLLAMPHETMTDMPHCMYPEGLYTALQEMATIGHPIIVTENGCADADDTRSE
jgi:beta-glucosidase/6-phospho-beta-glucosidase/beta-galactosidase